MTKRTGPTNQNLINLITELKVLANKENVRLWKRIAKDLERPTRIRRSVNIYKINKYTKDKETALIPGKVLSQGDLTKKISVAAFTFSDKAKEKINKIGKTLSIQELIKENPKGKNIRIIG